MLINHVIWRSRLRWSKLSYIKCENFEYGYDIKIVTKILSGKDIPEDQLKRLELIQNLYQQGHNSVQISNFLNKNQILSPTGLQYDPKLVWVSHDKFQKRTKRITEKIVSVDQDYFFIKEGVKY